MSANSTSNVLFLAVLLGFSLPLYSATRVAVPPGFEDIFNARQNGIFDIIYNNESIGSLAVDYGQQDIVLMSPKLIVDWVTAVDMPPMLISSDELLKKLSQPLRRVKEEGFAQDEIVANLNESTLTLQLIFPASLFAANKQAYQQIYVPHNSYAGFVHNHNLNFLSDSYSDSLTFSSVDTLNLTGNSYVKGAWSYSEDSDLTVDELALYLEHKNLRFKGGRQRLGENLSDATPSVNYGFFNPLSFDGVSLGYMKDNYLNPGDGAASPVTVYLPQPGMVEVYRNDRLIDLQQFSAGLHYLDTSSWPSGGYDVLLVSKLSNGVREEKIQPFLKRSGTFRSGEPEYIVQLGSYKEHSRRLSSSYYLCRQCDSDANDTYADEGDKYFAGLSLGYTTENVFSFGGGLMVDNDDGYANLSLDFPLNSWFAERLYADGVLGDDGSNGYQIGLVKNLYSLGMNLSYRQNRFKGAEDDFQRYSLVPAWDYEYLQFGASSWLPWNMSLGVNYGLNTLYQDYGRRDKTRFENWDVNLNREFQLSQFMNLRVNLGYHRGTNQTTRRHSRDNTVEDRLFAQFTLGMRERSYNHYQSLYLRSKISDEGRNKATYSADYTLNVDNPDFDRAGRYTVNSSLNYGPDSAKHGSVGTTIENGLGYSSLGVSKSFGNNHYKQVYLSQRSGFAVGEKQFAWGKVNNNAALIVDAEGLPADQYFEVRNRSNEPLIVQGGKKSTLSIQPYQKISPVAEQVYSEDTNAFYNLATRYSSTKWVMPGQVYHVKLAATRILTVTGKILAGGEPLANARIIGGNAVTDNEGFFVADFTLNADSGIEKLSVKKEGKNYSCPISQSNVNMAQGIMQIREVNCEAE